jgi:hypothetical protein
VFMDAEQLCCALHWETVEVRDVKVGDILVDDGKPFKVAVIETAHDGKLGLLNAHHSGVVGRRPDDRVEIVPRSYLRGTVASRKKDILEHLKFVDSLRD